MMKVSPTQMQIYVDRINKRFPVHGLWDGYKIRMFKRNNLLIAGSQDWIYYHNIDVIFKKVIFFNLPAEWEDTNVMHDQDLFRLSTVNEFKSHHPDFDTQDHHIFAFDFIYKTIMHTYFVVATNVFLELYDNPNGDGLVFYKDPLGKVGFMCKENRVL